VEIGRTINGRYLLRGTIRQGQMCTVYHGVDQRLQRNVAVKVVPVAHIADYKAAVQKTAQFSHPNIISLFDLIVEEQEKLYLVQELVEGNDFAAILQMPLQAHEAADFGVQLCQALLYAADPSRQVCHGDLTPSAILRDSRGCVRINNFALPSDLNYFTLWSKFGGEGAPIADTELPWGLLSAGRQADDVRAVGLILYQLLAGRPAGATLVQPSPDGQLYFMRSVPPALCQVVARTVIRQYPEHISNVETLYAELQKLSEELEPAVPVVGNVPAYQPPLEAPRPGPVPTAPSGSPINALPVRTSPAAGSSLAAYRSGGVTGVAALEQQDAAAQTIADVSLNLGPIRQGTSVDTETGQELHRSPARLIALWLLLGLVAFALFFVIGYFVGHLFFPG
jgi:eukaryotic-like serine/threonine-protein kinase